jgi:nitrite reductase/ring-hydroxylating ferredoxin subunit
VRVVVARVGEFADGDRKIVDVNGKSVGVFRIGDAFFAVRNRCPHQFGPLCIGAIAARPLSDEPGDLRMEESGTPLLACPWHGWEYDLATGQSFMGPGHVDARRYDTLVQSGREIAAAVGGEPEARPDGRIPGPYVAETLEFFVDEEYVVIDD